MSVWLESKFKVQEHTGDLKDRIWERYTNKQEEYHEKVNGYEPGREKLTALLDKHRSSTFRRVTESCDTALEVLSIMDDFRADVFTAEKKINHLYEKSIEQETKISVLEQKVKNMKEKDVVTDPELFEDFFNETHVDLLTALAEDIEQWKTKSAGN